MPEHAETTAVAALTIFESLLLALNDRNVLPEKVIMDVLKDAAQTLEVSEDADGHLARRTEAAGLIRKMIAGGNSVRRP